MREISYAEANVEALRDAMRSDPRVCLMGSIFWASVRGAC